MIFLKVSVVFSCFYYCSICWRTILSIELQLSALLSQALEVLIFPRKSKLCDNLQKSLFHAVENFRGLSHFLRISKCCEISRASYQLEAWNPTLSDKEPD